MTYGREPEPWWVGLSDGQIEAQQQIDAIERDYRERDMEQSPNALLARARAEAKDEAHTCKWQGTRYGCHHNADAAYVATVMEIADREAN